MNARAICAWLTRARRAADRRGAGLPRAVLDHADELHRRLRAGRARPGAAHRRRRHGLLRPGRLHGHRRLRRPPGCPQCRGCRPGSGWCSRWCSPRSSPLVLGAVTLRLKGHFLSAAHHRLGAGDLLHLRQHRGASASHNGIRRSRRSRSAGSSSRQAAEIYYLIWAILLAACSLSHNLLSSRIGRAMRACAAATRWSNRSGSTPSG